MITDKLLSNTKTKIRKYISYLNVKVICTVVFGEPNTFETYLKYALLFRNFTKTKFPKT